MGKLGIAKWWLACGSIGIPGSSSGPVDEHSHFESKTLSTQSPRLPETSNATPRNAFLSDPVVFQGAMHEKACCRSLGVQSWRLGGHKRQPPSRVRKNRHNIQVSR